MVLTGQPLRVSFALEYLFWGLGMCVIAMFAERRLVIGGARTPAPEADPGGARRHTVALAAAP